MRDASDRQNFLARCGVGLAQGLALYGLARIRGDISGHALIGAGWFVALLLPTVLLAGIGAMKRRDLLIWGAVAAVALAGLGAYAAWRAPAGHDNSSPLIFLFTPLALFIAHHLVQAGLNARSWRAPYPDYFDLAWTHGVRLVLAVAFTGAFWVLLWLGAALFQLIHIELFTTIIREPWFFWPATSLAFAVAVHLTAERANLVIGARALVLTLLSWLLPLSVAIAAAFLIALPFKGFDQLWSSHFATGLMLWTATILVLLVNAAYQSGEHPPAGALKLSVRAGAFILAPLLAVAAYGLAARIGQHGLSEARIVAAAGLLILVLYAAGYGFAAASPGAWMRRLPLVNVIGAYVALAILLALTSPLADPARLSTDSQTARLLGGKIEPARFDYANLAFRSGKYGRDALSRLAKLEGDARKADIAQRAKDALALKTPWAETPAPAAADIRSAIAVKGPPLPDEVVSGEAGYSLDACATSPCRAYWRNVDDDEALELVIAVGSQIEIYDRDKPTDKWKQVANACCAQPSETDTIETAAPRYKDLMVGDTRLSVTPGR